MRTDATGGQSGARRRPAHRFRPAVFARLAGALAVVGLIGALVVPGTSGVATAASAPPYTLTVSKTTGLVDGEQITVTVQLPPGESIGTGSIRICRPDATFTSRADLGAFSGKCAPAVSSSQTALPGLVPFADGSGAVSTFTVGVGTATFGPSGQFTQTCDPTHQCRLVVLLPLSTGDVFDASNLLQFSDDSPTAACGGNEPGAVTSAGPDAFLAPWIDLTKSFCIQTGRHQPTQVAFIGEGEGQQSFNAGTTDLVYSSVGRRFPGHDDEPKRDAVSVPVALDAAVIGVFGGFSTTDPKWPAQKPKPYGNGDLKITMAEAAALLGQGADDAKAGFTSPLQARNPELDGAPIEVGIGSSPSPVNYGPAQAEGTTWLASNTFVKEAGVDWRAPSQTLLDNPKPSAPRGPIESMALADPPFSSAYFNLYSSRSSLQKIQVGLQPNTSQFGPQWVLTDLATATFLGIPTVAVQNSRGEFVQPTAASLQAATATMTEQPDGTELPSIGNDAPGAYPLTFVEHAVAPHEPLLDDNCAPRSDSQQLLTSWLHFLTTNGQAQLSNGLAPLPAAMLAKAQGQVSQVGTAPVTGQCGPAGGSGGPGGGATAPADFSGVNASSGIPGSSGDIPGSTGLSGSSTGGTGGSTSGGGSGGSGSGGSGTNGGAGSATAIKSVDDGALPGFGGGAASAIGGTVALLALALVGGVGGYVSSRRNAGSTGGQGL
jgi:hypothetical protein